MERPSTHQSEPGWAMEASASPRMRRFSELSAVEADLDEIAARNPETHASPDTTVAIASLDAATIWENYNKNKGTPLAAHRRK